MKWLLGCAAVALAACLVCGCSGVVLLYYTPDILVALATSDAPLAITPVTLDPAAKEALVTRISADLDRDRTTRVTGAELSGLVGSEDPGVLLRIDTVADRAALDLSLKTDEGAWLNVHVAGAFVIEHGWFTDLRIDEARLSDWELGSFVAGQQLAPNANQSLAQERVKDPTIEEAFAALERVAIEDGTLRVTLTEAGLERLRATATP